MLPYCGQSSQKNGKKRGIKTAEFLAKEDVDVILGWDIGEGPLYVLSNSFIRSAIPHGETLDEIMEKSVKGI